ncbi:unnamed protein product [Rhizophagus irregularis]|nr:unnamed protein product [Rhizophagus irregularis]
MFLFIDNKSAHLARKLLINVIRFPVNCFEWKQEYHEIQTTFSTLHYLFNLFGGQQQPCIITFSAMSNKIKGQRMSEHNDNQIIYILIIYFR